MTFGETIAYWYLRLNGFFPLPNFVLHRYDDADTYSADCDLLAGRFPFVYEKIGGSRARDWDPKSSEWKLEITKEITCLVVEIKTGRNFGSDDITRVFSVERLEDAVQRLGIWEENDVVEVASNLETAPFYRQKGCAIGKLLIAPYFPQQIPECLHLTLQEADQFISERMRYYTDPKMQDKRFFPSDLIHYIIWKHR